MTAVRQLWMPLIVLYILMNRIGPNMATNAGDEQIGGVENHQKKEVDAKIAELQSIREEIAHLMKTSEDYGGPFESIEVSTLKTFSDVNGYSKKTLASEFGVPKLWLTDKLSRDEQIKNKSVTKRIHFIRHGEGHHNVAQRQWREKSGYVPGTEPYKLDTDPEFAFIDAILTDKGEQQALFLQNYVAQNCSSCTMLVLSPMRRATQTGLLAFTKEIQEVRSIKKLPLKIVIKEEAHERSNPHTCDKRLDVKDLKKFFYETQALTYGNMLTNAGLEIDYSEVLSESDPYWGNGLVQEEQLSVAKRGCKLLKWIYGVNDMEIAIAAHSGLLMAIFGAVITNKTQTNIWFATGEIKSCDVTFNLI